MPSTRVSWVLTGKPCMCLVPVSVSMCFVPIELLHVKWNIHSRYTVRIRQNIGMFFALNIETYDRISPVLSVQSVTDGVVRNKQGFHFDPWSYVVYFIFNICRLYTQFHQIKLIFLYGEDERKRFDSIAVSCAGSEKTAKLSFWVSCLFPIILTNRYKNLYQIYGEKNYLYLVTFVSWFMILYFAFFFFFCSSSTSSCMYTIFYSCVRYNM